MSLQQKPAPASPALPSWSLTVRVLHWGLVLTTLTAFATAWLAPPSALSVHVWLGAAVAFIVVLRLMWGFFGPWWERFSAFPLSTASLSEHLTDVTNRRKPHHHWPAHPPLGAAMVVILLVLLAGMVLSGVIAYGGQERAGLLASWVPYWLGHMAAEGHELLALLLGVAIVGHLSGVFVESALLQSPLVKSMITGLRPGSARAVAQPQTRPTSARLLWGIAFALAAGTFAIGHHMAGQGPYLAGPSLASTQTEQTALRLYETECGACHMAYPPAVLPASSWVTLLAELPDHFGEDASLPPASISSLSDWLQNHAAETWQTKAGHAFQRVLVEKPYQITATPFWQHRHNDLSPELFKSRAVGGAANCRACHQDVQGAADSAGFARSAIHVPDNTLMPPH